MSRKNELNLNEIEGGFAENGAELSFSVEKKSKKTQKQPKLAETGSSIDKKLVKSIQKDEKRQLKESRRQEKAQKKAQKKERKEKLKSLLKAKKLEEKQIRLTQEQTLRELEKRGRIASWFRLDNAASIYPSSGDGEWNFVFRITANLKKAVDPDILQSALDDIMPRFPSFNVRLCHGFFWNYYERNFLRLKIEKESTFPCRPFNFADPESFLLRVLYADQKIMVEVFHSLTDKQGALFFLNSLLARYFEKQGIKLSEYRGCTSYLDLPSEEEVEDSFALNATKEKLPLAKERAAYKIKGNILPKGVVNVIEAEMSIDSMQKVAEGYGASLAELVTAIVGYAVYKRRKNSKKTIRISVPIDLRKKYNSSTLRNFSSHISIDIDGENLSFDDILQIAKDKLRKVDDKLLQAKINANGAMQKNVFVKIMPLFIKNIILNNYFNCVAENYQTLTIANLGEVETPKEFEEEVESYCLNMGRSAHDEKSIGVAAFNGKLNICISSKLYETETERDILTQLASLGVEIKVFSNRRDLYATR